MIHYHGTPVGGKSNGAAEFVTGRAVLIPWKRPDDLQRACELSRQFMVDNSAYSFWSSGERPDWMQYVRWVRTFARHPRFDFAIVPDVIDGTEDENDELIRWWDKVAYVPERIRYAVVWHLHESLERLERLCRRHDRVCIGSSGEFSTIGTETWWRRMSEAMDVATDGSGVPLARLHGLRMLRRDAVEAFPFTSSDSTTAVQNGTREAAKNGVDSLWGSLTIARRIEQSQSPSRWVRAERQAALQMGLE